MCTFGYALIHTGRNGCRLIHANYTTSEAQFIVPDWGDKVDSGIGLSTRQAT